MSLPTGMRSINYGRMLYEALRNYYSVTTANELSILFKYSAACVAIMQQPFDDYNTERQTAWLIAQCAWEIGQLTNVLNFLYDPSLKRIYISQSVQLSPAAPGFAYTTPENAPGFAYVSPVGARGFFNLPDRTKLTFYVPSALTSILSQIAATIAQVAIEGIEYQILTF
jgi:hypothetical protein